MEHYIVNQVKNNPEIAFLLAKHGMAWYTLPLKPAVLISNTWSTKFSQIY